MNAEPLAVHDARGTRIPTPAAHESRRRGHTNPDATGARLPVDGAVDPAAAPEFPKPTTDTPSAVESLI
jgi:hypothetical protein